MKYNCTFSEGNWNTDDFLTVISPRWQSVHSQWEQHREYISNRLAPDWTPADRSREGEAYISMLHKTAVNVDARIETSCLFEERMAPVITLAKKLTPVHEEHLEIVVFDEGINLWHHKFDNGKPSWKLIAYQELQLQAHKKHHLVTEIRFAGQGNFICMGVDDVSFGCLLPENWPQIYYAGITACEGRNRFYDFSISEIPDNRNRNKRFNN